MTAQSAAEPLRNPFVTRRIRPGAIPFLFPAGETVTDLVARFERLGRRGQIVGPHGSGKSTLLAALIPALERTSQRVISYSLHDGQRRLPATSRQLWALKRETILIVDGYEQLNGWNQFEVRATTRLQGEGLLVSAHADVGLPPLYETRVTPELALRVVRQLEPPDSIALRDDDVLREFAWHKGDLRETLFSLYDLYESRCRRRYRRPSDLRRRRVEPEPAPTSRSDRPTFDTVFD